MAVGDNQDIYNRFIQNLPSQWFGNGSSEIGTSVDPINSNHPNLDILLQIFINTYFFQYNNQYLYELLQQRIQTATDVNLDIISQDYEGNNLPRLRNESDDSYRKRILSTVVQIKATRQAMSQALFILTGFFPIIYEPWNGNDGMYLNIPTGGLSNFSGMPLVQHIYGNEALGGGGSNNAYIFYLVVFISSAQGLGDFPGLNMAPTGPVPVTTGNPYFGLNNNWYVGSESLVTAVITPEVVAQVVEFVKTLGTFCKSIQIVYVTPT